jgi:transcriptional regulatory protein GAL4
LNYRHLTDVEDRLGKLEAVFANLLPNVDIEDALSSSSLPQLPTQEPSTKPFGAAAAKERIDSVPEDRLSEALPQEADGFDWKEEAADVHGLSDGMAALSVEPSGIGYLGVYYMYNIIKLNCAESLYKKGQHQASFS